MINVTKTYLPPFAEYSQYLQRIWESGWVTNRGPLLCQLESDLKKSLEVNFIRCVNNGTIALQLALKALDVKNEIITTPFSYVATTSSISWEGYTPVFADIDPHTLTIDPKRVEASITEKTSAILATHVYGGPCNVEALEAIALKHDLKIIYDAAHCFGVRYRERSILDYGDASTLSFHATKLFHTIEGGAVISRDANLDHKISYMMNFGHDGPEAFHGVGINGKSSEFNAAMGLCLLPRVSSFISRRKDLSELYDSLLIGGKSDLKRPKIREGTTYNFAYYPIIFPSEKTLLAAVTRLAQNDINPRRYFYPSLSTLKYVNKYDTAVAEDISRRILCLPLYFELSEQEVQKIAKLVLGSI